jgi:TPR repeat protein
MGRLAGQFAPLLAPFLCAWDSRGILAHSEKALPPTEKCFDVLRALLYEEAMKTSHLLMVVMVLVASAVSVWADDQAVSVDSLKNRAAQGNAEAQYNLGVMYARGDGLAQDYAAALKWFCLAAAQGLAEAQYNLGVMYLNGQGIARDEVQAYKWLDLAAATYTAKPAQDEAVKVRDSVAARMTPAQIAGGNFKRCVKASRATYPLG